MYGIYNVSARKNRARFSHVRVCGLQHRHFPRQICVYIMGSRGANGCGGFVGSSRLKSPLGISCLGWMQTRLKSAQTARHDYDEICAHNLHGLYYIDKFPTDSRTLFDDEKMCECTKIFHVKM